MAGKDPVAAAAQKYKPIQSAVPGTTLGPIQIDAFFGGGKLYDTPGVHLHHRQAVVVHTDDLPVLAPQSRLKGQSFPMEVSYIVPCGFLQPVPKKCITLHVSDSRLRLGALHVKLGAFRQFHGTSALSKFFNDILRVNQKCNSTWDQKLYSKRSPPAICRRSHDQFVGSVLRQKHLHSLADQFVGSVLRQKHLHSLQVFVI